MAVILTALLSLLAAATTASPTPGGWQDHGRPFAQTDAGPVLGFERTVPDAKYKLNVFHGVPFAAPPVRWSPPVPPAPWDKPRDASTLTPACMQQFNYPEARRNLVMGWFNTPPPPESEDCLYLHVYAPVTKKPSAVLVWIYGGSNLYGSNWNPKYDGGILAANEDIVMVILNYRTNLFGFPGADVLPEEERNLGFLDQRLALDWVRRNIAAFGGDPSRVTVFGESAGALAVDALLTAPPNPPTFHAAIMESGTATYRATPADPSVSWRALVGAMGCNATSTAPSDILACMRALPATQLRDYSERNTIPWAPSTNNNTFSGTARTNRLTRRNLAAVPILGGTNAEEGRLYSVSATDSDAFVANLFPAFNASQRAALLAQYPVGTGEFANDFERLAGINTDFIFRCPCRLVHRETLAAGLPSYRYLYNASFPNTQLFEDSGVYHASELRLVFGTYDEEGATAFESVLSHGIQGLWAGFAKDPWGWRPVGEEGGVWEASAESLGVLGGGVRAEQGPEATGSVLEVVGEEVIAQVDKRCELYQPIYDILGH